MIPCVTFNEKQENTNILLGLWCLRHYWFREEEHSKRIFEFRNMSAPVKVQFLLHKGNTEEAPPEIQEQDIPSQDPKTGKAGGRFHTEEFDEAIPSLCIRYRSCLSAPTDNRFSSFREEKKMLLGTEGASKSQKTEPLSPAQCTELFQLSINLN